MMEINVGIDLSTTQTGMTIMNAKTNEVLMCCNINFRMFSECNFNYNMSIIHRHVGAIGFDMEKLHRINVGIELSNYSNPMLTNRFNLYAGAFISEFVKLYDNVEFKLFNSLSWQSMVGAKKGITQRVECKELARKFAKEHCKQYCENWSEDMCDAYCIAYLLPKIKSTETIHSDIKLKKSIKVQRIQQQAAQTKMIVTRTKELARLDKNKNKKRIETLIDEIENLQKYGEVKHGLEKDGD